MRKTIMCIITAMFLLLAGSVMAQHQWYNGRVTDIIKEDIIKVDNNRYTLSPKVRVVQHVKVKASINEESARLDNVLPGQRVTIKIDGGFVTEIIIERYH